MTLHPDRELDFAVHQLLFGQADTTTVPRYSTTFAGCLLVDARLGELGWTRASTERAESRTRVTLRHADSRSVVGEGVDQFEATCKAAISPEVIRMEGGRS